MKKTKKTLLAAAFLFCLIHAAGCSRIAVIQSQSGGSYAHLFADNGPAEKNMFRDVPRPQAEKHSYGLTLLTAPLDVASPQLKPLPSEMPLDLLPGNPEFYGNNKKLPEPEVQMWKIYAMRAKRQPSFQSLPTWKKVVKVVENTAVFAALVVAGVGAYAPQWNGK